jgi:hypothetical protein
LTAVWYAWGLRRSGIGGSDFDQVLIATRMLLEGRNPYALIGPGRLVDQPWPLYYPIPAAFPALAFVGLPIAAARIAYAFALAWAFAFLITRDGWHRIVACMSGAYLSAFSLLQWSPLAACAVLAPRAFGWMVAGKPNSGAMVVAAAKNRRALVWLLGWGVGLTLVSLLVFPGWPAQWRAAVAGASHVRPYVMRPGGWLLLLALIRWRRPEARWLAALALVPTTGAPADALVLFAFPHTFREGLVLAHLTHMANFYLVTRPPAATFDGVIAGVAGATLVIVFLPALLWVLLRPGVSTPAPSQYSLRPPAARAEGASGGEVS